MEKPQQQVKPLFFANWKMYVNQRAGRELVSSLLKKIEGKEKHLALALPYTMITSFADSLQGQVRLGAQNMSTAVEGAFTGEISGEMLKEAGASFVILGHSERRELYGDNDALIVSKIQKALDAGLELLLCVGESEKMSFAEASFFLEKQLKVLLSNFPEDSLDRLIIAYEPSWAVGAEETASLPYLEDIYRFCRSFLKQRFGDKSSRCLLGYGGAVSQKTAASILRIPSVDALLIGRASLDADSFANMIHHCLEENS